MSSHHGVRHLKPNSTYLSVAASHRQCCVHGQVLLGQHSGSDDIVDVTSVAGRPTPEVEPLMGACCVILGRCFM